MITTVKGEVSVDINGNKVIKATINRKGRINLFRRILKWIKNLFK